MLFPPHQTHSVRDIEIRTCCVELTIAYPGNGLPVYLRRTPRGVEVRLAADEAAIGCYKIRHLGDSSLSDICATHIMAACDVSWGTKDDLADFLWPYMCLAAGLPEVGIGVSRDTPYTIDTNDQVLLIKTLIRKLIKIRRQYGNVVVLIDKLVWGVEASVESERRNAQLCSACAKAEQEEKEKEKEKEGTNVST